jgi:hypothetical protein
MVGSGDVTEGAEFGLSPKLQALINSALADGHPVVVGSVEDGRPRLSFYGTTQALGPDRLALWMRPREGGGGLATRLGADPWLAFLYRNPGERVLLQVGGRAVIAEDGATRDRIFEGSPEIEQRFDPERRGTAVVVELDVIEGYAEGQRIVQRRAL